MQDCIFCKIIAGEIPCFKVYEDNHCLAFLDIHPCSQGHTVVVPKVHAETLFDLNDELAKELMTGVKCAMERIEAVLAPDGYNVGWNHAAAGGQEVKHLHVHILPRREGDGGTNMHAIVNNTGDRSVSEVATLFHG